MVSPVSDGLLSDPGIPQRSRPGTLEVVVDAIRDLPRGRALDVPCGPGYFTEALRRLGFEVTAGDLDAASFALHGVVPFRALDLDQALPFGDASFDLVYCGDGIEHLENPFALFREFGRILAPEGTLVIVTPNYQNVERRLRFLFTGSLTKPVVRPSAEATHEKHERGHINPLTLTRACHMAEAAGLEIACARSFLPKPRQRLLAPLAVLIRLYEAFLPPHYRRDLFAEHTFSLGMLLGGKKTLMMFRKSAGAERRPMREG